MPLFSKAVNVKERIPKHELFKERLVTNHCLFYPNLFQLRLESMPFQRCVFSPSPSGLGQLVSNILILSFYLPGLYCSKVGE